MNRIRISVSDVHGCARVKQDNPSCSGRMLGALALRMGCCTPKSDRLKRPRHRPMGTISPRLSMSAKSFFSFAAGALLVCLSLPSSTNDDTFPPLPGSLLLYGTVD